MLRRGLGDVRGRLRAQHNRPEGRVREGKALRVEVGRGLGGGRRESLPDGTEYTALELAISGLEEIPGAFGVFGRHGRQGLGGCIIGA